MRRLLGRDQAPRIVDLLFHLPTGAIDRRARPKLRDVVPGSVVTVAVTVDRHRPSAAAPSARALSDLRQRRHRRPHPHLLQRFRKDYLQKLYPVGERRYVSGTTALYDGMLQMVHPDRVVDEAGLAKLPLIEPVYPLTEGLQPRSGAQGRGRRARAPSGAAGMAECRAGSRARSFPPFADALRHLHRPAEPGDIAARRAGLVAARL